MKKFKEIMTRKLTRAESYKLFALVAVIGLLMCTLAMRNPSLANELLLWSGMDIAGCGSMGIIATATEALKHKEG